MGLKWSLLLTNPLLLGYENTQLVQDGYEIQFEVVAIVYINSGTYVNILFIILVKIIVLIQWSYRHLQSRLTIMPFWARSPISFLYPLH
jgi:hypothetical protein